MKLIGAGVLGLALFATACSGSSSRLTQAELVGRVNAICRDAGQPYGAARPTQPAAFLRFLQAQIPAEAKGLAALERLRPPADQQRMWSAEIIAPERAQLARANSAVRALMSAAAANDQPAEIRVVRQTIDELDGRGVGINGYWQAHGMTNCLDSPL